MEVFQEPFDRDVARRYELHERVGEGAFGEVRRARDRTTGQTVAVKFIRLKALRQALPKSVFRELEAMKQLAPCAFIVRLRDIFADENSVCAVLEYVDSDLSRVIAETPPSLLPRGVLKGLLRMMLAGLRYCHEHNVIHRDVKPSNFLFSKSAGVVKLADFGLARIYDEADPSSLSHQVATRAYRAPELLYGSRRYSSAVDMWGFAVSAVELMTLRPLFPGNNDIDQMFRVFQVLGTPTPKRWPGVESLPDYSKIGFAAKEPVDLRDLLSDLCEQDVEFARLILALDPARRPSASQTLRGSYFHIDPLPSTSVDIAAFFAVQSHRALLQKKTKRKPVASVDEFLSLCSS